MDFRESVMVEAWVIVRNVDPRGKVAGERLRAKRTGVRSFFLTRVVICLPCCCAFAKIRRSLPFSSIGLSEAGCQV